MTSTLTDRIYGESASVAVKAPCAGVAFTPIPLNGLGAVSIGYTPKVNDRILVMGQANPAANGIYNASVGAWARSGDFDGVYDAVQGTLVVVISPTSGGAFIFQLTTFNPIIGTSPLNFSSFINPTSISYALTFAEFEAGVNPTNLTFEPYTPQRVGVVADNNVTDDTAAWAAAILVAAQTVNGAKGATVDASKLTGISKVSSQLVLPNRVRIKGPNASGLIFTATPTHPGPYMFYANNGAISMFDSILEDMYIDCNSVAGLSAIRTDAWQENSGLRSIGIKNCAVYGVHFFNVGAGGQATCEIEQLQLFAAVAGMTAGIKVDLISSIGSFQLHVRDSVIAGNGVPNILRGIDMVNDSLLVENCHFESCADAIYLDGSGKHVISHCSGSIDTTTLVHIAPTFTGSVVVIGCQRNSSAVLVQNDATGETIVTDVPLYVYPNISSQNTSKGWCFFDGTTAGTNPPIAGSNVLSVQRISAGRYRINFVLQTLNANIAAFASSDQSASGAREWIQAGNAQHFLVNLDVAGVPTDANEVHVNFFAQ